MTRLRGELLGMPLSPREKDVLVARVNTGSNTKAARRIGVSIHTLENHLTNARLKLGANNTPHAAALAYRQLWERYLV